MQDRKRAWLKVAALGLGLVLWFARSQVLAQELTARLFVTGVDTGSPPIIELHAFGMDSDGNPLDLTQVQLSIRHNNTLVSSVEHQGVYTAGTFTLFLIDIPTGVTDQLPAIQEAIIQYASSPTMAEQVDSVAVYQVGETAANELLSAEGFYNGVRNLFATPLVAVTGATALVDSMMGLLEEMDALKPSQGMAASMVVVTDGTDVISTRFEAEDVATRAAALGIPIHTIWLDNADLTPANHEQGQRYLQDVARGSRGLAASLTNRAELPSIWNRIASFRDQSRIRYTVNGLTGGTFPVELSLEGLPEANAETSVTIAGSSPTVVINLPPESRALTLPDLEEPARLRFSTTVTWLDGVERQLTAAQLIVNESIPQSLPVENLADFELEVQGLRYGNNTVQIAVLDEQGLRVTSPLLLLTIIEGRETLPAELEPGSALGALILRVFLLLFLLVLLAGSGLLAWRQGWLRRAPALIPRGPSGRIRRQHVPLAADRPPAYGPDDLQKQAPHAPHAPLPVLAYLEVLESVSRVPAQFPLSTSQVRIGRSPAQAEIAFENDITVSRIHAGLMLEGDHYRIFDEQSTSGTWVNEQQVPEYGIQLLDGDEIHLGAVHLRFRQA
jgi:hypothetical protein